MHADKCSAVFLSHRVIVIMVHENCTCIFVHLPPKGKPKITVRGYEPGREDHGFDPRLGNFFPFKLTAWELRALKPQVGKRRKDLIVMPSNCQH